MYEILLSNNYEILFSNILLVHVEIWFPLFYFALYVISHLLVELLTGHL